MEIIHIFSLVLVLSAGFAYINYRFIKLPGSIGLMLLGLMLSLIIQGLGLFFHEFDVKVDALLNSLNFSQLLLEFMLSFLLFAGALHTDMARLREARWPIFTFATLGVVFSTIAIGFLLYYGLIILGYPIDLIYCFLFGALISPTDPIAVMGILKKANLPMKVEVKITGESLFNDGIGVVVFLIVLQIIRTGVEGISFSDVGELILMEVFGGIALGLIMGWIAIQLLKSINHYQTEVLISIAIVVGGYSLSTLLHMSGPLAVVVAGLMIGNKGKETAMSDVTWDYLNKFWEMMDEILNAVLFVLIGLEVLIVPYHTEFFFLGLITFVIVVVVRYASLAVPSYVFKFTKTFAPNTLLIMTWGGLRGGISIALALSLSPGMEKDLIVAITYTVVLFSILLQGLTIGPFIKKLDRKTIV